jgi:DnaJ-class molecular chaperone
MNPVMTPCERCGGSGRIPRLQRRRADGTPDPLDIIGQHREICDRCGGSGEMPADSPQGTQTRAFKREQGYAADLI